MTNVQQTHFCFSISCKRSISVSLFSLAAAAALAPRVFAAKAGGVDPPAVVEAVFPLVSDAVGGGAVTDLTTSGEECRDSDELDSRSELEERPRRRSPRRR